MQAQDQTLLDISGLVTQFGRGPGAVRAVDGLDLTVNRGEVVAIVGESGCGKSITSLSVMGLLPRGAAIAGGAIRLAGTDLAQLSERAMRARRGAGLAMIFQEPMTSLNPSMTVAEQIAEPLYIHRRLSRPAARARALELLRMVGIPDAEGRMDSYPHQMSGGQRQRVMIAIALACEPDLLIADEPTTALDVTVQAQILDVLREMRARLGTAILLITHDFGVVAELAERVIVMYAGRKVEEGPVARIFDAPQHPYTRALMAAMPRFAPDAPGNGTARLHEIPGVVPVLQAGRVGCAFAPRCALATDLCHRQTPAAQTAADGHLVACFHPGAPLATSGRD